ncbi:unnamed protein product [Bursaphelenchus okinawaensis]|uniref:Lipase n=1 Tax=Bursaphelenchus okinawaensis TaxID=465554 RepID=A0A811KT20_9BILA|nr:unnamed protein product [Bursaphelenchus okinawaensis]CAG9111610.1 unnamed protein product [Bursaphelenchus okinawaensis]
MSLKVVSCLLLATMIMADLSDLILPEEKMPAMELIEYWGYYGEEHIVETEDGWILPMHRIPRGKNETKNTPGKPVVILQHGLECSSDNFLLNLPSQSPGFVFADAGFDFWIPNTRGNSYTSNKYYDRTESGFWHFTSDEMQMYDMPAYFDVIENVTGLPKFYYVGHSQGTYIMFAKLSWDPSFADRVIKYFALGPGVVFKDLQGVFDIVCDTNNFALGQSIWDLVPYTEFSLGLLSQQSVDFLTDLTCTLEIEREYCAHVYYLFGGPSTQTNVTRMPVFTTHIPAGASTALVQKYCQTELNVTGGFRWYRYPTDAENIAAYGSVDPPLYNLTRMEVPLYLYSTPDDWLTTLANLEEDILPNLAPGVLQEDNRYPGFAHMDLIWGLNATDAIFNKIIATINKDL